MAKITDYIEKLRSQVERMNAHPYKETSEYEGVGRYFKEPLCAWEELEELKGKDIDSDEAFDAINKNEQVKAVLDTCRCDVFLFPDRGGYMYLIWSE